MSRGASNQLGLQGVSVNGIRNGDSSTYFDGIQSQDNEYGAMILLPNQDGIQEFKMQTSGRDATTGRTGGAAVNLVTKSGGNDFHGDLFEFFRNSDLDARNYFDPPQIPAFHQNQFGGTWAAGSNGQDVLLRGYSESSSRFRGSLSSNRADHLWSARAISPSFPTSSTTLSPRATSGGVTRRKPFSGDDHSPAMISPIGAQSWIYTRCQNLPGLANNYGSTPPRTLAPISGDLRIDHRFSDNDYALWTFQQQSHSGNIVNPGYFPQYAGGPIFPGNYTTDGTQGVVGFTHVFSPSLPLQFRAGYSRIINTGVNFNQGSKFMDQIGIPGIDGYGYQWQAVGVFSITGPSQVGGTGNIPFVKATNNKQYSWHFNWIHDRHRSSGDMICSAAE